MTRYEITAEKSDRVYLIGYSPRLSRSGLLAAMQSVGNKIISKLQIGDNDEIKFFCKPRVHSTMDGWRIGFTGRTQKEAVRSEHEYIAD